MVGTMSPPPTPHYGSYGTLTPHSPNTELQQAQYLGLLGEPQVAQLPEEGLLEVMEGAGGVHDGGRSTSTVRQPRPQVQVTSSSGTGMTYASVPWITFYPRRSHRQRPLHFRAFLCSSTGVHFAPLYSVRDKSKFSFQSTPTTRQLS